MYLVVEVMDFARPFKRANRENRSSCGWRGLEEIGNWGDDWWSSFDLEADRRARSFMER